MADQDQDLSTMWHMRSNKDEGFPRIRLERAHNAMCSTVIVIEEHGPVVTVNITRGTTESHNIRLEPDPTLEAGAVAEAITEAQETEHMPKLCYFIDESMQVEDKSETGWHYQPSIVKEGVSGHYPTDYDYGTDFTKASRAVNRLNKQLGLTPAEVKGLVLESMFPDGDPSKLVAELEGVDWDDDGWEV